MHTAWAKGREACALAIEPVRGGMDNPCRLSFFNNLEEVVKRFTGARLEMGAGAVSQGCDCINV
jgi:hypothetical protein